MMKSALLDRLNARAATAGARVNRTGNGAFVILYRGQRHLVVNLRAAELVVRQFCVGAAP